MSTLIIKTNVSQATDIAIEDMGFIVPNSGGSVTLTNVRDLKDASLSYSLVNWATDNAFGANNSTIILNNGTSDVPQSQISAYLLQVAGLQGATGLNGFTGIAGLTGISGGTGLVGNTGLLGSTGGTGIQGGTGLTGVTGIAFVDETIVEGTTSITTTGTSFGLAAGMTITPAAGTYAVWFSCYAGNGTANAMVRTTIYSGGSEILSSRRTAERMAANFRSPFCSVAVVTVNGSQAIEGRWSVSSGTGTMISRNLLIFKV